MILPFIKKANHTTKITVSILISPLMAIISKYLRLTTEAQNLDISFNYPKPNN